MIIYAMRETFLAPFLQRTMLASPNDIKLARDTFHDQPLSDVVSFNASGNEATIAIIGPLSLEGPSFIDRLFGYTGTSYKDIIAAADLLRTNVAITDVNLMISSPGGTHDGLGEAYAALLRLAAEKNLVAQNHGEISSAAYYLAVAASRIEASSPLAITGSIGAMVAGIDTSEALKRDGVKRIQIVSSNAPKKNVDLTTTKGVSIMLDHLDAVERIFFDVVATGRNTTLEDIKENFGQGGVLVALDPDENKPDALSVGMIDSVTNSAGDVVTMSSNKRSKGTMSLINNPASNGGTKEGQVMNLSELKSDHPAVYASAVGEGESKGIELERNRVATHLVLGEASGDMKLALKNIADGVVHSGDSNALYTAAQLNRKQTDDRQGENVDDLKLKNDNDGGDSELTIALAAKLGVQI